MEVTGRVYVQLYASSSCLDSDFMAKLTDVYPDGRFMLALDGAIRTRHRNSMETKELLDPGRIYEFWIDLWSTSIVFNKGHRIRLSITSSNYPRFDANPNTGEPFGFGDATMVANNTIYMGSSNPSRVILPLAGPDTDDDGVFDLLDPTPLQIGTISTEEASGMIRDIDTRISLIGHTGLRDILALASDEAKARLEEGNIGGAGHLLAIIDDAIQHDPQNISFPEAVALVNAAVDRAGKMAGEGNFVEMADCITAGWKLGNLWEELEGDEAAPVLDEYLDEARSEVVESGCGNGLRLVEWLRRSDVRLVAAGIGIARKGEVSDAEIGIIEGLLSSSKEQYLEYRLAGSESMLEVARKRLKALGIPESTMIIFIILLGSKALAIMATRRRR